MKEKDKKGKEVVTDCEKFARKLDQLAKSSKNTEEFVRRVGRLFAGFPTGRLTTEPNPVNKSLGLGGSGFSPKMNDGDGHPWRHAAAFIVAGYDTGESAAKGIAVVWELPFLRGSSMQDVRLGASAAELGVTLREGLLTPAQAGQWVRDHF